MTKGVVCCRGDAKLRDVILAVGNRANGDVAVGHANLPLVPTGTAPISFSRIVLANFASGVSGAALSTPWCISSRTFSL